MVTSLEQITFLDEQNKAMHLIFNQIEIIKALIKKIKQRIQTKKIIGEPQALIFEIEYQLKKLQIFIKDFNKGDFTTINKEIMSHLFDDVLQYARNINK